MKIERTKNASRNIVFGFALKMYQLACPFIIRTIMIHTLGMEYIGLNSLFTSILQVLNMTELGVGSVMIYSMYTPIAEDDTETICALLNLYKKYYRIIGFVILTVGLVLTPVIPHLISGDLPFGINIYTLYYLNLCITVFSYWLFAYKNSLLVALQRSDISCKINIFTNTIQYIIQIFVLLVLKNYYYFLIVALFCQIINNLSVEKVTKRRYLQYLPTGKLDAQVIATINHRVRDLFTNKVGGVIVNSADSIVISAFLGLSMLAIYNNYYYILTSVIGFITTIYSSCTAGIGNSLITETKEKNYADFKKLTLLITWIVGFCTCCFLSLYQHFMLIWVGVKYVLDFSAVICFSLYFYTYEINQLFVTYKDAAGIWHQDRYRPLITALINLFLNLLTVNYIGIYGVLLSTVVSTLVVGMPWLLKNIFSTIFKNQMKNYILLLFKYTIVTVFACLITYIICSFIPSEGIIYFTLKMIVCCIVPNIIYYLYNRKSKEFESIRFQIKRMLLATNIFGNVIGFCRFSMANVISISKLKNGTEKQRKY